MPSENLSSEEEEHPQQTPSSTQPDMGRGRQTVKTLTAKLHTAPYQAPMPPPKGGKDTRAATLKNKILSREKKLAALAPELAEREAVLKVAQGTGDKVMLKRATELLEEVRQRAREIQEELDVENANLEALNEVRGTVV